MLHVISFNVDVSGDYHVRRSNLTSISERKAELNQPVQNTSSKIFIVITYH